MRVIPAIDLIEGKCVRLVQGDYSRTTRYDRTPLDMALEFQDAGFTSLHLVDLDGARDGCGVNRRVLEQIAAGTDLRIDFGGGIRTDQDVAEVFDCGASQVVVGSIAAIDPERFLGWVEEHGTGRMILGADARNGRVTLEGWRRGTDLDVVEYIARYRDRGVLHVYCTDVARDGMMEGPGLELYREILRRVPDIRLTASGGVSTPEDLYQLREMGLHGAVIGKALYEGTIRPEEAAALC